MTAKIYRSPRARRRRAIAIAVPIIVTAIVWIATRLGAFASATLPAPNCPADSLMRVETPLKGLQYKAYTGFNLAFSPDNHTPVWCAWELLRSETDGAQSRARSKFWTDSDIVGCPDTRDYSNSGFDRGHIVPAADQKWSPEAMTDCFSLANICPQDAGLNRGVWQTLEKMERRWARRDSAIIIIAGPIYTPSDQQRIGRTQVRVPSAFFKAFLCATSAPPRAIAFVFPNTPVLGNIADFAMPVDQLEKITGYDLFAALPDSIENKIEATASFRQWNR